MRLEYFESCMASDNIYNDTLLFVLFLYFILWTWSFYNSYNDTLAFVVALASVLFQLSPPVFSYPGAPKAFSYMQENLQQKSILFYLYNYTFSKYLNYFIYFDNTYNVIKVFFRVEYKKSINAEIIQPF